MKKHTYLLFFLLSATCQKAYLAAMGDIGHAVGDLIYEIGNTVDSRSSMRRAIENKRDFNNQELSKYSISADFAKLCCLTNHGMISLEAYMHQEKIKQLMQHSVEFSTYLNSIKHEKSASGWSKYDLLIRIFQNVKFSELKEAEKRYKEAQKQSHELKLAQTEADQKFNNEKRDVDLKEEEKNKEHERAQALIENEKQAELEKLKSTQEAALERDEKKHAYDLEIQEKEGKIGLDQIQARFKGLGEFVNGKRIGQVGLAVAGVTGFAFLARGFSKWYYGEEPPTFVNRKASRIPLTPKERLWGKKPNKIIAKKLIFDNVLQKQISEIEAYIKTAIQSQKRKNKNPLPLKNVMLYGPPGGGKSAFSEQLGIYFDVVIKIDGGSFHQGKLKDFYHFLHKTVQGYLDKGLFVCITFDEGDAMFKDRDVSSGLVRDIVSAFLGANPEGYNKRLMMILLTNKREDIDDAVDRRFPCKIEVSFPKEKETIYKLLQAAFQTSLKHTSVHLEFSLKDKKTELSNALLGLSPDDIVSLVKDHVGKCRAARKEILSYEALMKAIADKKNEKKAKEAAKKAKKNRYSRSENEEHE